MKKIFLLLLIPTMLYCDGKPQIKFDTLTHDFGKQKQNSELKYTFTFTNIGKGTLIIEKITAG